jgi:hypothetical protein
MAGSLFDFPIAGVYHFDLKTSRGKLGCVAFESGNKSESKPI